MSTKKEFKRAELAMKEAKTQKKKKESLPSQKPKVSVASSDL